MSNWQKLITDGILTGGTIEWHEKPENNVVKMTIVSVEQAEKSIVLNLQDGSVSKKIGATREDTITEDITEWPTELGEHHYWFQVKGRLYTVKAKAA